MENNLKDAKSAAGALNGDPESFSYSVAHNLRVPLCKIAGYSEILQWCLSGKLDDQCLGYLNNIKKGAVSMDRIIESLLRLSKIGRQEMGVRLYLQKPVGSEDTLRGVEEIARFLDGAPGPSK